MKYAMKPTVIVLLMCLLLGLAACSSPSASPSADPAAPADSPAQAPSDDPVDEPSAPADGDVDLSEHVELVLYVAGDPPTDETVVEDAINAKLNEKLNASLDLQFTTWTDFQQKYSNQLTSGGADLIYIAGWFNYGTLANAGAFLELDDLLAQYAPELKERAGEDMLNMCRVGGELYAVPALWPEYVPGGISYREDLRAKYDLPRPDSIENAEAFFQGIKDNEPDQPILRVTAEESTGLTVAFDAATILNIKYPWVSTNGLPYGLAANIDSPSQVYDYWYSDDFVEDCKLLKKWADAGYWSKSALSDTNDPDSYKNGLNVAIVAGQNPNKHITNVNDFAELHPDWQTEYIAYGEITGAMYPGHATQNGTAIVRGCKNPERAMMVLNYLMMDEEMNKLIQGGVEGTHYELSDGIYTNLSDSFPYEGFNTWNLRVNEFKLVQQTDLILNDLFAKYEQIGAKNKYPNVNIAGGFSENYEDYQAERTAVSNVMRQYLAPIQAGMVADVDAAIAEFRQKVEEAGLEVCRENYKSQWVTYCTEYGYQ